MRTFLFSSSLILAVVVLSTAACESETTSSPDLSLPDAAQVDANQPTNDSGTSTPDGGTEDVQPATCPISAEATIKGTLQVTADDNYKLYVNGVLIDETPRIWSDPQTYEVTLFRSPKKKNVIAIQGNNTAMIGGLDRGVIADLTYTVDATKQSVVTNNTWKLATTLTPNWFDIAFDDTTWIAPTVEGANGIGPYGFQIGSLTAEWLWSYNAATAASKPVTETIYLRKSFYLDVAGTPQAAPPACP